MSKTKWETKQSMQSSDLAALLRRWANEIDDSKVEVNGLTLELPQLVEVKRKFKERDGLSKIALKISWPAHRLSERKEIYATGEKMRTASVPGSYKEMKKLMEKSLNELERALADRHSAPESLALYLETVGDFRSRSKPDWLEAVAELEIESDLLKQAVNSGANEEALAKIARIRLLKKKYHDMYK